MCPARPGGLFSLSLICVKTLLLHLLLLSAFISGAQDQVYFLDGSSRSGKVTEIAPEHVILQTGGARETIDRGLILLIEFKNGSIEVMHAPEKSLVYDPEPVSSGTSKKQAERIPFNYSLGSVNTLALCNADISGFYERILPNKKIGIGAMAAYNFNARSSVSNLFISVLNSAKKKYDLGGFVNIYTDGYGSETTTFYFGVLFKYMRFSFYNVIEEKVNSGGAISTTFKYRPTEGSQLATIFTCGTHTSLNRNFFFKTLIGLGGFNLRGDYRAQYNYALNTAGQNTNTNSNPTPTSYDRGFLLKLYAGLNFGFSF